MENMDLKSINDEINAQIESLTPDQLAELQAMLDPVLWAENTLKNPENQNEPLRLRDYQKEVLHFQPYFIRNEQNEKLIRDRAKILRMGRRTGKTVVMAVEALWKACTNSNHRIIYVAPYESQCSIFFGVIEKLLAGTIITPISWRKKPYYIQFSNLSQITGYTANVRSSARGSSMRGTEGDHIILDEMDFGMDSVIGDIVAPILNNNNIASMTAASTPSGRRETFYKWCCNAEALGYKHFHFPSSVSPKWTSEAEANAKLMMTKEQYTHEILAEFGEALEGVFRHVDIDKTLEDYSYSDLKFNPDNRYVMGVDWNETYGVCIVVVEHSKRLNMFRVFKHSIVEKQDMTQLSGIEKILEIHNKVCRCNFIYVDKGYGATQIELLKRYGMQNPGSNVSHILKEIDYGGKITVHDIISGLRVEKSAKPFLVDNTQYIIENNKIRISKEENIDKGIIGQMRNFRVSRFSAAGNPVYEGDNNDHSLNALFLALAGYNLEFEEVRLPAVRIQATNIMNVLMPQHEQREGILDAKQIKLRALIREAMPNTIERKPYSISQSLSKELGFIPAKPNKVAKIGFKTNAPKRSSF